MIDVVIPSPQVNKAHLEYEKEIAYVERWQNELLRMVLKCHSLEEKDDTKLRILNNANSVGLNPMEEFVRLLNLNWYLSDYNKFKRMTNF